MNERDREALDAAVERMEEAMEESTLASVGIGFIRRGDAPFEKPGRLEPAFERIKERKDAAISEVRRLIDEAIEEEGKADTVA